MGWFDWLTGSKPAPHGVKRQSVAKLREGLMAVNRKSAPFKVRDGKKEGVDLVAEWKIVDAKWYEVFAKAGIERVFKVLMKIDEAKGEVRAVDQEWEVEWRAGTPSLSLKGSAFRGQKMGEELRGGLCLSRGRIVGRDLRLSLRHERDQKAADRSRQCRWLGLAGRGVREALI